MERDPNAARVSNSIARSLPSLAMVVLGVLGSQLLSVVPLSGSGDDPPFLPVLAGLPLMLFVLPAALVGILGGPTSWPILLTESWGIFRGRGSSGALMAMIGTLAQTLFFQPISCPRSMQGIPDSIKLILFRQPEHFYKPPKKQRDEAPVKNECWIYMNGVSTTLDIARANSQRLYEIFGRPIHICHNPTDGLIVDILECITGKVGFFDSFWLPQPRVDLKESLETALQGAAQGKWTRVVLVAHSQGTIISANALADLSDSGDIVRARMKQFLEVYAFANCAQVLEQNLKYMENISNQCDTVAWMGALFPFKSFWQDKYGRGIQLQGTFVTEKTLWGHLLNTHYLDPFCQGYFRRSRLHQYRNGRTPIEQVARVANESTDVAQRGND